MTDNPTVSRREKPIGVFDSGIGGLTVVRALRELLPNETIFYLGDTARVPYGGKSAATVERYSLEITSMLLAENCKTVVVACNTASALALPRLEETTPVPITGVIRPGAQAAVERPATVISGSSGPGPRSRAAPTSAPCSRSTRRCGSRSGLVPLFVPLIEEGWLEGEITDQIVRQYLTPLVDDGVDTLVLGCTHYPLLREAIGRFLGDSVRLVDSAQNCATAVAQLLEERNCGPRQRRSVS